MLLHTYMDFIKDDFWELVRHIPASLPGWDPAKDRLQGTEVYGDPSDNSTAWAINFADISSFVYKVESVDKTYSKEYKKSELVGKMHQEEFLRDKARIMKRGGANVYI